MPTQVFSSWIDGTSGDPEGNGDLIKEEFQLGPVDLWVAQLVGAPAHKAGDQGSNPGTGKNLSIKLTTKELPEGYSKRPNIHQNPSCLQEYVIFNSISLFHGITALERP